MKKKKYQTGGTEPAPFSVDDQIIDYTNFLSPDSMDMLNYYQMGGMEPQPANGGEMMGDAVMPFTSFNGDLHKDPSRGIFLGKEGDNQRKVQDGESRIPVDANKIAELMMAAGEDPQVTLSSADKNGKVNVIVGDMKDPETGKKYQDLVNKKKSILKNDPTNTRVLDEIEKELEKIALRQEAHRVMEERFPDGPPAPPSPQQAQALNQNMAMMQMLQGQGQQMQQPQMQQNPIGTEPMDPQAVPLAQKGMPELKPLEFDTIEIEKELEKYQKEYQKQSPASPKLKDIPVYKELELPKERFLLEDNINLYNDARLAQVGMIENMTAGLINRAGGAYNVEQMLAAMQQDPKSPYFDANAYISSPFNTNFLDDNYLNVKQRPGAANYAESEMQTIPSKSITSVPTQALDGPAPSTVAAPNSGFQFRDKNAEALALAEISKAMMADQLGVPPSFAKPEDSSGTKDKDKNGQPDYVGMGILAGAGLASNIGNIMYLAEQGKKAEYEDPGKYMVDPRLISLDEQRKDIETRMNRVAYENRMRGQGDITREAFLAGQELQQMAPTYEREQNLNAQVINQTDQFNAQMRMNVDDFNARNRAAALKQYYDSISQIGQNINNLAIDINQRRENAQMYKLLEDYFPNYGLQNGQWVFKGTKQDKA